MKTATKPSMSHLPSVFAVANAPSQTKIAPVKLRHSCWFGPACAVSGRDSGPCTLAGESNDCFAHEGPWPGDQRLRIAGPKFYPNETSAKDPRPSHWPNLTNRHELQVLFTGGFGN